MNNSFSVRHATLEEDDRYVVAALASSALRLWFLCRFLYCLAKSTDTQISIVNQNRPRHQTLPRIRQLERGQDVCVLKNQILDVNGEEMSRSDKILCMNNARERFARVANDDVVQRLSAADSTHEAVEKRFSVR